MAIYALPLASASLMSIAVAVTVFLFVATLVVAVFGQRGQMEMTPERQVALATGHADRRTVFENPMLHPLMWLLLVAVRRLGMQTARQKLRQTLIAAGSPNYYTVDEFLAVSMLWGILLGLILEVANMILLGKPSVVMPVIGFVSGMGGYVYNLFNSAGKRIRDIARRVPYTLDLIALAMGAGATFTEAIRTVVKEDPQHPFNVELNTLLAEVELGTTRARALRNIADRIPLDSLRSIMAAIIQAEGLGTPLSAVLKEQASLMRLQRSVRAEKLAAAASVRILVPSLLILMSVVLTVFSPFIIRAVKGELF